MMIIVHLDDDDDDDSVCDNSACIDDIIHDG